MSATIPEASENLLTGPIVVTVTTLMPSGQPQSAVVWCSYDGEYIWVNSADGRQKNKNLERDPRVSIVAIDPKNPYRYLEVRGEVDEIVPDTDKSHINSLSLVYRGYEDYYKNMPQKRDVETRTIYKIKPKHVVASG